MRHSPSLLRNLLAALLVLLLGAVLWLSGASTEPAKPSGRLAEAYQAEILSVLNELRRNAEPSACSMAGNSNLGVTCRFKGAVPQGLAAEFQARGWQVTLQPAESPLLLKRGSERLSVQQLGQSGEFSVGILRLSQ